MIQINDWIGGSCQFGCLTGPILQNIQVFLDPGSFCFMHHQVTLIGMNQALCLMLYLSCLMNHFTFSNSTS